jgi:ABC-type nitrate/sulfonate/bicarbonate transport system substrate-binding protein
VREAGETPNFIMLSDYGFDAYNLVIFTTETTIEEKPELVESVLRAIIAGYEDAIADPNQAADYIVENNPELDREGQLQRLQAMIPLINIPGQNLGVMDEQIWIDTQTIMLEAGSLDNGIDPQSVFTTSFLDKIYE